LWNFLSSVVRKNSKPLAPQAARIEEPVRVGKFQWKGVSMREGKYESSQGVQVGTAITFLLIGLGAGALIGMLFAPKTGRQMRKELRQKYEGARETIEDWKADAQEAAEGVLERGAELAEELRERVTPLAKSIRLG
jgi:gas vesicle protein